MKSRIKGRRRSERDREKELRNKEKRKSAAIWQPVKVEFYLQFNHKVRWRFYNDKTSDLGDKGKVIGNKDSPG